MNVASLLGLIDDELLEQLALETKVDHQVKKLNGSVVFKLILFSMLNAQKVSLRIMEDYLNSASFRHFINQADLHSRHSSIRDRICTINYEYFERLFASVFERYNELLEEQKALVKVDSTYVGLSAKLVAWSMKNGNREGGKRQAKFSISLKGTLPCHVRIFHEQPYISENRALSEAILEAPGLEDSMIVFDRGLQSRDTFDRLTEKNSLFVGRANTTRCRIKESKTISLPDKPGGSTVTVHSDQTGLLISRRQKYTNGTYRLIKATIDQTNEPIHFLTNILDMSPYEIAAIYKQRWDIEVFFRFLKQHLNLNHIISRNDNGMRVMIYMTLITAILILVYRKLNNIESYKIAKHRFEIELDNLIMREVVILCGGNPDKAPHLWNSS